METSNNQELLFDPLLAPIHPNGTPLTEQEAIDIWLYLKQVSEETYQLLSSSLIDEALHRMQQTLGFTDEVMIRMASLLRMMYFGKITFEQFPELLQKEVGIPQDKVAVTVNFIQAEVLSLKAIPKQPEVAEDVVQTQMQTTAIMLLDALAKYPRINDQQITTDRIKIRSERESVRGTVRNWLRAYRDSVGVRQHSAIERGQFLFQSENAKGLSAQEREKVAALLKSLDDREALAIDVQRQEIVFPVFIPSQTTTAPPSALAQPPAFVADSFVTEQKPEFVPEMQPVIAPQNNGQVAGSFPQAPQPTTFNFSQALPDPLHPSVLNPQTLQSTPPVSTEKYNLTPEASSPLIPLNPADEKAFHFSSGHILPAEKQSPENPVIPSKTPSPPSSFGLGYNPGTPFRSSPQITGQKKEVWEIPSGLQNVVDLRAKE